MSNALHRQVAYAIACALGESDVAIGAYDKIKLRFLRQRKRARRREQERKIEMLKRQKRGDHEYSYDKQPDF